MADRLKTPDTPVAIAFRNIEPTWRNYIYYVDQSARNGDEQMLKFRAAYNALPWKEKNSIMPEQLCDMCGIICADLVAAVSRELWIQKAGQTTIEAAINHPRMIQATAFYGQMLGDANRDRELFFRVTGGLPDKKGTSIVINNTPQTANITAVPSAGGSGYKPMDQRIIDMGKLLDEPILAVPVKDQARVFSETHQPED